MTHSDRPVARFVLVLAGFVIIIAGIKAAESLLVPFLLSLFITVICSPALGWLQRRRVPTGVALILIIVCVVIAGFGIGAVVGKSVADFRADLPDYQLRMRELSGGLLHWLQQRGISVSAEQWRETFDPAVAFSMVGTMLSSLGNVMTNAFMILLTVIFILAEEVGFTDKMVAARPEAKGSVQSIRRFTDSVNQYMALKTALSLLTGFCAMLLLLAVGVDYPVLWGLLAFLLNFVPTLGSIIAAVPAVLLALIQLGVGESLVTAAGYLAINVLVGNVLEPRFMGRGLDLSTLVVFLSLVFWGWVLGPVGMLLSVPLTMTVKIALEGHPETRWVGIMLGAGRPPTPESFSSE